MGQQDIVLNCNYHFDSHEAEQLEVKWYFNKVCVYHLFFHLQLKHANIIIMWLSS